MIQIDWISGKRCPSCDKLRKTLIEIQDEFPDVEIKEIPINQIGKIYRDDLNIQCVPFILFKIDNKEVKRAYGCKPLNEIIAIIDCLKRLESLGNGPLD